MSENDRIGLGPGRSKAGEWEAGVGTHPEEHGFACLILTLDGKEDQAE